ncbi:glutaredoxin family protein [Pseudomonas capsici]|uniref:Glutaredoxin family protein n=1 Tax=Pseudomonas capsici TaxID=2810614 RepID=A0ABT3C3E6_9PSED|nr:MULTISPECIES: glutaredoxin family protein [Pseudomonas]MBN6717065.1 glutaredoxin family protein [Pseudomonas capsici]MBN6722100.1 glutaredoxin family protein [Pseudomonas capsici]MBN6727027.1 glutaredoxin family protein [Pseudomonas capsici]MBX8474742.1 glutaredoxin family protein [Pseudomonas cichorii]MBX8610356.1 glutaredoxin family protein [Pseudomonas cichorii]
MLLRTLKKFALIMLVVVVYQNWGKIENLFNPQPASVAQSYSQARVVMYATEWCGYCKQTRRFLDSKGIAFTEYDIEKSAEGRKAYEALGGRGIPLLDVNGTLIRGFSPDAILAALK